MSVPSHEVKTVISEYAPDMEGNHWPSLPSHLAPHQHGYRSRGSSSQLASCPRACHRLQFWNGRGVLSSFRLCHCGSHLMTSKTQPNPDWLARIKLDTWERVSSCSVSSRNSWMLSIQAVGAMAYLESEFCPHAMNSYCNWVVSQL